VLGGLLLAHFWWGSVFLINVPIVLAALPLAARYVPGGARNPSRPWDLAGSLQAMAGMILCAYGLKELGKPAPAYPVAAGAALAGIGYTLFLESGKTVSGTTDDDGCTGRIATETPERIVRAELEPQETACCPLHAERADGGSEAFEVELDGVSTNSDDIGASIRQVETPKGESRGLTTGEIAMARLVFGDSVDYAKVKVHNGEYLWFGMQPDDTAMTPNGEMYFNTKHFKEDYSESADLNGQQWFMHEMTHVWQHQLGYPVKWRGAVRIGLSYGYTLSAEKKLCDYNMEAQGNILADYFVLKHRNRQGAMYEEKYWYDSGALDLLEVVLSDFLEDPGSKENLP